MLEDKPAKEHLKQRLIEAIRRAPVRPRTLTAFAGFLENGQKPGESATRAIELFREVDDLFRAPPRGSKRQDDSILNDKERRKLKPVIELFESYKQAIGYRSHGQSGGREL